MEVPAKNEQSQVNIIREKVNSTKKLLIWTQVRLYNGLIFMAIWVLLPVLGHGNEKQVLVFAGSTRVSSVNKKLAQEAASVAHEMGANVTYIDLKDYPMPFYDGDLEKNSGMPKHAKKIRDLMMESQTIVIASPEYNGSLSAVLKNVIDWASRGENGGSSNEAFKGKQFAIMSASPGKGGGVRGLTHLRAILKNIGGEVVEKQVMVPNAYEEGSFNSSNLKAQLREEIGLALEALSHTAPAQKM